MPALASLLVPPADPLSPGWPLSSDNAQWLPGVPEGDTPSPGSQGWVLLTLLHLPIPGAPHLSSSFQLSGVACTVTGGGMALPGSEPALRRAQGSLRRQQMSSASSEEET